MGRENGNRKMFGVENNLWELGQNIAAERMKHQMSQMEVSKKCELGLSPSVLSAYENGAREPSALKLYQIAKAIGTTVDALAPEKFGMGKDGIWVQDQKEKKLLQYFQTLSAKERDLLIYAAYTLSC